MSLKSEFLFFRMIAYRNRQGIFGSTCSISPLKDSVAPHLFELTLLYLFRRPIYASLFAEFKRGVGRFSITDLTAPVWCEVQYD